MTRQSYASALDKVLGPIGFIRDGRVWNRILDGFHDNVNLQVSTFAGTTANLMFKDLISEQILLETIPPGSPQLMFPVSERIGYFTHGTDHWWRRDPNGPQELSAAVEAHAPKFFDDMHSLEAQARRFGRYSDMRGPAPQRLYLAITLYRMGEKQEACDSLAPRLRLRDPVWAAQMEALQRRFGCKDPGERDVGSGA